MHVIMVTFGTDGDVLPYLGLGTRLRERGHRVTLVTAAGYESQAIALGLEFRACVTASESQELLGHPDFWNPLKTLPLSSRWGVKLLSRQYQLLSNLCANGSCVLVANPGMFAARQVHDALSIPLASLILQPTLIPSVVAPPEMPMARLPHWPRWAVRLFWRGLDAAGDYYVGRELNRLRRELRLVPRKRLFQHWLSPQLILGLFPEWFSPPPVDWPTSIRLAGFPQFDGTATSLLSPALESFLNAGPAPVAVTFGTGMQHAHTLFQSVIDVLEAKKLRGVFLTRYRGQLPSRLPPSLFVSEFAPFRLLFPRCSAAVHHGGIGTTASALAAGVPQIVLPFCFDQMDNGYRLEQMGVGVSVRPGRNRSQRFAEALDIVGSAGVLKACQSRVSLFEKGEDPFTRSAEWIEALA